jgi:nucleotide-binding universal stress UspA family protein
MIRTMNARITVGFDGTTGSADAAIWAADEAVVLGLSLRVVSCLEMPMFVDPLLGGPTASAYASLREAVVADVARLGRTLAARHPALTVTGESSVEPPAAALMHGLTADDLLVVGAGRHHDLAATVLGSTTRRVLHESPCPVVVVRGPVTGCRPGRVVVGTGGCAASDAAVRWAAGEADRRGVGLVVVHAWSPPHGFADPDAMRAREVDEFDAACTLERSVRLARARCATEVTGRLVERTAASALLVEVDDGDLLVLGSPGRGGRGARLFGPTVDLVLELCAVPIVLVRAPSGGEQASPGSLGAEHTALGAGGCRTDLAPVR